MLGLLDFERRAQVYRSAVAELEAKLRTLVPIVPAFMPRRRCPYFTPRQFGRGCQDAMREAEGKILTADEIAIYLMRRKGLDIDNIGLRKSMRRRVRGTLHRITERGDIYT